MNTCISGHAATRSHGSNGRTCARCSATRKNPPIIANTRNANFMRALSPSDSRSSCPVMSAPHVGRGEPGISARPAAKGEEVIQRGKHDGAAEADNGHADKAVEVLAERQGPAALRPEQREIEAVKPAVEEIERPLRGQH